MRSSGIQRLKNTMVKFILDVKPVRVLLYKPLRWLYKMYLWGRSFCLRLIRRKGVQNVYMGTVQKTGSMWIRTMFSDPRIKRYTKLDIYPQHRYEYTEFIARFPKYTLVPNLYIGYPSFEIITKPKNYKACYFIRDPRNVVVSWYHSMRESHRLVNPKVEAYRRILQDLEYEAGIRYCIEELSIKFAFLRSWMYRAERDNVLIIRFEDIVQHPFDEMKRLLAFIEVDIPDPVLRAVLDDYSKEKMRARDLARRMSKTSNYGTRSTDWCETMSEENLRFFYQTTGDLVELMGYER